MWCGYKNREKETQRAKKHKKILLELEKGKKKLQQQNTIVPHKIRKKSALII